MGTTSTSCLVVTGTDAHAARIEGMLPSLRWCCPESDLALATFGSERLPPSERLSGLGLPHYDAPRQDFLPERRAFHACELIGMLTISRHYYRQGYDLVVLLHSDVQVVCDVAANLRLLTADKEDWSFCARLVTEGRQAGDERLSQECVCFSSRFVRAMYGRCGGERRMWAGLMKDWPLWGDLALFKLTPSYLGYEAVVTTERTVVHP